MFFRFVDHFARYMKLTVIGLLAGATVSLTIFTLICAGYLPDSKSLLYLTSILGYYSICCSPLVAKSAGFLAAKRD